jgi:hypothetical protein
LVCASNPAESRLLHLEQIPVVFVPVLSLVESPTVEKADCLPS